MDISKRLYNKQRGLGESGGLSRQHTVITGKAVFTKVGSSPCMPQHYGKLKRQPFKKMSGIKIHSSVHHLFYISSQRAVLSRYTVRYKTV